MVGISQKRFNQNVSNFVLIGRNCYVHSINCITFKYIYKKFSVYFQTYGEEWNWIHDPFSVSATKASLPLNAWEELFTLRAHRVPKTKFAEIPLDTFQIPLKSEYTVLSMMLWWMFMHVILK